MPGLDDKQVRQFQEDGYLIVRDGVCGEAIKPLIRDLEETVNGLASDAVEQGVLGPGSYLYGRDVRTAIRASCGGLPRTELDLEEIPRTG